MPAFIRAIFSCASLLCLPLLLGCGTSNAPATAEVSTASASVSLKNWLLDLSQHGTLDSSSPQAIEWADQMIAANEPNAAEIKKDVEEILSTGDAEKIKAHASKTAAKIQVSAQPAPAK
jgi:hypothetical protein